MQEIKGGNRKPVPKKEIPNNDIIEDAKHKKLPSLISVKSTDHLKSIVPPSVWSQSPFKWDPVTFVTESEKLNDRIVEPRIQNNSLESFIKDSTRPIIYGISGNPDDSKAKLFASYLIKIHLMELHQSAHVIWHTVYGGYENTLLKEYKDSDSRAEPTLLVLSNLTINSTSVKLEKARDLIERFPNIPRLIVCAGQDPMSFLFTRLQVPVNALAYFSESIVKRRIEVI
jgi:hypothetical protein